MNQGKGTELIGSLFQGSDPSKVELMEKVRLQQKRVLNQATAIVEEKQR